MSAQQFCPYCEVSLDLHGVDDVDDLMPSDCEHAVDKADLMARFFGPFAR